MDMTAPPTQPFITHNEGAHPLNLSTHMTESFQIVIVCDAGVFLSLITASRHYKILKLHPMLSHHCALHKAM